MSVKMNFSMLPAEKIMQRRGMEEGGRVQKIIDSEVLRLCKPYTPFKASMLSKSGDAMTRIGSGEVRYKTPYARYQYYGKVMVGPAPKRVSDKDLTYHGGGKRGSMWFERMKSDHKEDILRAAAGGAGGKAK